MNDVAPQVRAVIDASGLPVEVLPCDPEAADTAVFCQTYGVAPEDSANAILVVGKSDPPVHVCCVVLATTRLDVNGTVRRKLGVRKASFAPGDVTLELTGMQIGGVTPVGLPDGVPVWIDAAVMARGSVVIGGGNRSSKLRVEPGVLVQLARAEVVDGLAV